jgi:RNA polymerase sigma factor (sigma-70 family)
VTLSEAAAFFDERSLDLFALDDALDALEQMDPQKARIVELRFFSGMTVEETAEALGVSTATITRQWRLARAWLYRRVRKT